MLYAPRREIISCRLASAALQTASPGGFRRKFVLDSWILRVDFRQKAESIRLFSLGTPQMRAFHMSWIAFFLCFFAWFGIAPLMSVVRDELHFTKEQVGWCMIGSVAITIVARLVVGWLCDRFGPRLTYTWLLVVGSLPVVGI